MKPSITVKPKKRGRPATGVDPFVGVRFPQELLDTIDAWGAASEQPMTRSEAIRRLVERGLTPPAGAAAPVAPAPKAPPLAKLQAAAARGGLLRVIAPGGQQTAWAALLASVTPGGKPLADCTRGEVDEVVAYVDGLLAALRTHALTAAPVYGKAKGKR